MPWVRFTRAFAWTPPELPRVTMTYAAGCAVSVRGGCKARALQEGAAEAYPTPGRRDPRVRISGNGQRYIPPGDA